ncbi:MAG: hypothetical protein ACXWPV_08345 [Candidatus Limnocylindrales bacterium]
MTPHDFDGALRAALSTPMTARQRASLDERLLGRLQRRPRRARLARPRAVALLLGALLVTAPAVFAVSAALRSTESPNGLASAAAFQADIDAAKKVVPLPAGATWPPYLTAADKSGSYSAGGARTWVEFVAFCTWDQSWLAATASGESGQAATARDVILSMPSWEFYRGDFATDSSRAAIDTVIAGVRTGDKTPVAEFVRLNCGQ